MRRRNKTGITGKFSDAEIVQNFEMDKPDKTVFGNYRIEENRLVYRAQSSDDAPHFYKGDAEEFAKFKKEVGEKIKNTDGRLVDSDGKIVMLESLTKNSEGMNKCRIQYYEYDLIAQKVKLSDATNATMIIGNVSTLPLVGRTVSYGNVSNNNNITSIQMHLQQTAGLMLPLNDFADADFETFELVEKRDAEHVTVKSKKKNYYGGETDEVETREIKFSGAALFRLDGKTYLYDIDRREIKYKFMNRFLTEVSKSNKTIDEAYESLKPIKVDVAEESGADVKRVGAWFFIPTKAPQIPKLSIDDVLLILGAKASYDLDGPTVRYLTGKDVAKRDSQADKLLEKVPRERAITIKDAKRPLNIQTCIHLDGVTYCYGKIESDNRATLELNDWHIAVKKGA